MSEQLIPKKGDRVRLVHGRGAEVIGTVVSTTTTGDWRYWEIDEIDGFTFYQADGWSATEILERPFPLEGSFVQGLLHEGDDPFVGRATGDPAFPFSVLSLSGVNGRVAAAAIKSWELVK